MLLAHQKIVADGRERDPKQAALDLLDVDLHFHDLRRECASRWWNQTKDIWRVSQWLGHSSIKMTQRCLALTDTAVREPTWRPGWGIERYLGVERALTR